MKAAVNDDRSEMEEEEVAETSFAYKKSLLDSIRKSYEDNKELRCTRVLYIGHMTSLKQKEIVESIHSEFVESQSSEHEVGGALLFINNNLFYHMLEVESLDCLRGLFGKMVADSSTNFFRSLDEAQNVKRTVHPELENLKVKICCVSEEITREFPIWSVREVHLPGGAANDDENQQNQGNKDNGNEDEDEEEESEDQESLQNLLFETIKGMIEIGRQLCMKQDKDAAMKLFQSSQREIMNRFPTPDKIEYFLTSKLLFDLQQFRDFFFTPINIKLESEHTWPVEPMISF